MIIIEFGQFENTSGLGVVGYNITSVVAKPMSSRGITEVVSVLQAHSARFPKLKNVNLVGFEDPNDEVGMYTLCQSLKGFEYNIRALSTGEYYHPWYKLCDHLAVHVTDPLSWTKFPAAQVIYRPAKDLPREPDLPAALSGAWLYLDPLWLTGTEVETFLAKAKHRWGMFSRTSVDLMSEILFEGVLP